ncbi:hypothetical protein BC939DRAFT_193447 [Gamsiella multidivaricata]|uniref:uncharacterized protein n=1 Tax=Gamsiella multidivaricata TaxID=101098 RepID=UPI00221F8AE5|nr:uncharacterized protein BC939DRAFT_193447 [Gamsiella multidivaricata]KAI7822202.1 hypothetical protein BC939DRAFT_193447 [Gamsiella multidivaricata]
MFCYAGCCLLIERVERVHACTNGLWFEGERKDEQASKQTKERIVLSPSWVLCFLNQLVLPVPRPPRLRCDVAQRIHALFHVRHVLSELGQAIESILNVVFHFTKHCWRLLHSEARTRLTRASVLAWLGYPFPSTSPLAHDRLGHAQTNKDRKT